MMIRSVNDTNGAVGPVFLKQNVHDCMWGRGTPKDGVNSTWNFEWYIMISSSCSAWGYGAKIEYVTPIDVIPCRIVDVAFDHPT